MNKAKMMLLVLSLAALDTYAQNADSLLNSLDAGKPKPVVDAAFKATHVVLSNSTETQKKHDLDLSISHHFGDIGGRFGSSHTLYGLDVASDLRIGLDYGVSDRLTIGVGRSKVNETYDFSGKYKLLQQHEGGMPVNVTLLAQMGWIAREPNNSAEFANYSDRFSWFFQPLISRKITSRLSLQVMPGLLVRSNNVLEDPRDAKNLYTIGFAGRMKITKRLALTADYTVVNGLSRPKDLSQAYYNPLGVGVEIETGGHVFSLNFMNSEAILDNNFIASTKKSWRNGGIRFGFTISRNFTLFKSKNKDPEKRSEIY